MRLQLELRREETFSFTSNDGSPDICIFSGQLRQWLLADCMDKLIELTFPVETLDVMIARHGLEADRLESMTEEEAQEPAIVGLHPSGTHMLVDGAHRRAFWAQRGVNVLKGWVVPEEVWRVFECDDKDNPFVYHHPDGSLLPQRQRKKK